MPGPRTASDHSAPARAGRLRIRGFAALPVALAVLACSTATPVMAPGASAQPVPGRFARVSVSATDPASDPGERARLGVRQSLLDWLEQGDRLGREGPLQLEVSLASLRLRRPTTAWLFAWAVAPDHLSAEVRVRRGAETVAHFPVRVESDLAGFSWRERQPRLDRLARRLGRRIAEAL